MTHNFEKYTGEANTFMSELAQKLGHPEEKGRVYIVLRAVLHSLRDRITISESLDLLAQLPMYLKAIYVDNWKYREKPVRLNTIEEFTKHVEEEQGHYGETEFPWEKSTEEIIQITLGLLSQYITRGELEDILAQVPDNIKPLFIEMV